MQRRTDVSAEQTQQRPGTSVFWHCPRCRHTFQPQPTTVRCPRCGENLRKCVYCKFADTIVWECTHPDIRFVYGDELGRLHIPEPEHVWACPGNTPNLKANQWQVAMTNPLVRGLTIGAALSVVLLFAFWFIVLPMIQPIEIRESVFVSAQATAPSQVGIGDPVRVILLVTNSENIRLEPCDVFLRGSLVQESEMRVEGTTPIEQRPLREGVLLRFHGLSPGQKLHCLITLIPSRRRVYDLKIDVYCGLYQAIMPQREFRVQVR